MVKKRNLELQTRKENSREKRQIKVTNFDLVDIYKRFNENLTALKRHFEFADDLVTLSKTDEAKDIWRTQKIFL